MPDARLIESNKPFQGLIAKLGIIRDYYPASLRYRSVRAFAEQAAMPPGLGKPSPKALFCNLKSVFRYIPDPVGAELIKAPWQMVREIGDQGWTAGDCDDAASFAYTLLNSVGVPARLGVGWYGQKDPSHIWTVVPLAGGVSVPFDLCGKVFGETKPGATRVQYYG